MALNTKQQQALDMLTCGQGYTLKEIAQTVGINEKTLWAWRNSKEFTEFQQRLKERNDIRWQAAEDAARMSCIELCKKGNQKMVQFVLQNAGYNPTQKVEASVDATVSEITVNIGGSNDGKTES